MTDSERALQPVGRLKALAQRSALSPVPYLRPEEVIAITDAAKRLRYGERNSLLIKTLYQTGLRISEALSLTPANFTRLNGIPCAKVLGKGEKERLVHIPEPLYNELLSFAYRQGLKFVDRFFSMNRQNAHKMLKKAAQLAGLNKRVYPHLLRHSDAIKRLRQTGNPKALQLHLGIAP